MLQGDDYDASPPSLAPAALPQSHSNTAFAAAACVGSPAAIKGKQASGGCIPLEPAVACQLPALNVHLLEAAARLPDASKASSGVLDLLKALSSFPSAQQPAASRESGFLAVLHQELASQSQAISSALQSLWLSILGVGAQLVHLRPDNSPAHHQALKAALQTCDNIGEQLLVVLTHIDSVTTQLIPLTLLWDQSHVSPVKAHNKQHLHQTYNSHVKDCLTGGFKVDAVILGLSDCYALARQLLSTAVEHVSQPRQHSTGEASSSASDGDESTKSARGAHVTAAPEWRAPDQFRRSTTKYWVRVEDVNKLCLALLRHLPLLVFGRPEGKLGTELQHHMSTATSVGTGKLGTELQHHMSTVTSVAPGRAGVTATSLINSGFGLQERSAQSTEGCGSSAISSIYFDALQPPGMRNGTSKKSNKGLGSYLFSAATTPLAALLTAPLPVYHYRLRREDQSTLVRLRWYGPQPDQQTGKVFVERKLHREAWTGEFSVKERFQLPVAQLRPFLQGSPLGSAAGSLSHSSAAGSLSHSSAAGSLSHSSAATGGVPVSSNQRSVEEGSRTSSGPPEVKGKLMQQVQSFLTGLGQHAVLRTSYNRWAFQRSDTNAVRISLDTEVVMSMEPSSATQPWAVAATNGYTVADREPHVVHFPYAILEVKLEDGDSCPDWVLACVKSGLLVEVPKFSKFLHGMALLYPNLVRNTPAWFVQRQVPTAPSLLAPAPTPAHAPTPLAPGALQATGAASGELVGGQRGGQDGHFKEQGAGRLWGALKPYLAPSQAAGSDNNKNHVYRIVMQPATIQEVAMSAEADEERPGAWWFGAELTPEQLHDARPGHLLPLHANTGDSSCDACCRTHISNGGTAPQQQHVCALGQACQLACTWRVPTQPPHASSGSAVLQTEWSAQFAGMATQQPVGMPMKSHSAGLLVAPATGWAGPAAPCPESGQLHPLSMMPALRPVISNASASLSIASEQDLHDNGHHAAIRGRVDEGSSLASVSSCASESGLLTTTTATRLAHPPYQDALPQGAYLAQHTQSVAMMATDPQEQLLQHSAAETGSLVASRALSTCPPSTDGDAPPHPIMLGTAPSGHYIMTDSILTDYSMSRAKLALGAAAASEDSDQACRADAAGLRSKGVAHMWLGRLRGSASQWSWARAVRGKRAEPGHARVPGDEEAGGGQPVAPVMIRSRIEPKTFFAAERTFLSWLNLAVLVMFLALSLLTLAGSLATRPTSTTTTTTISATSNNAAFAPVPSSGGSLVLPVGAGAAATGTNLASLGSGLPDAGPLPGRDGSLMGVCGSAGPACRVGLMAGVLLAPLAMVFMCYALVMYRMRTRQILKRETVRYDDQRGPIILVVMLIILTGLAYGLSIKALSG